jgi:DNA-binding transcriptional ArsR family regulator
MEIDRQTLKALAADTRLDILKSLGKRRKTPSELSKELNLATSTVVEHLDKLEEAGLIRREETGHKWIYYNLTEKGSSLVKPKIPMNFVIVISICIIVFLAGFIYYQTAFLQSGVFSASANQKGGAQETPSIRTTNAPVPSNMTNITNSTNSTAP